MGQVNHKNAFALSVTMLLAFGLSGCDSKPNRETTEAVAQLTARVESLEAQQREFKSDVAGLRASAAQWTLWRQATLVSPEGFVLKAVAEDAFAAKADCLASAKARLMKAGAQAISEDPISGRFRDRTDRMYCLPNGVQP